MHSEQYKALLQEEASAFDRQIIERVENGHVPDLRATQRCEWFYNNVWRDPFYADQFYGQIVRQIMQVIKTRHGDGKARILEIACGPGHISLELARSGHDVLGVDVSIACIEVAKKTAQLDPWLSDRGALTYQACNVFDLELVETFDMVVFSCALHHFHDQSMILDKVASLLKKGGVVFVSEPTKQNLSEMEAAFIYVIRRAFGWTGHFYQSDKGETSNDDIDSALRAIQNEYAFVTETGDKVQSPLDNEANKDEMLDALRIRFAEISTGDDFTFFDRIVGGLRFDDIEQEHMAAQWIQSLDRFMLQRGHFKAQQFHFIGEKL